VAKRRRWVTLRALIAADVQADNYTQFASVGEDGINTRLQDCLNVLESLEDVAEKYNTEYLFFLGDLFNPRVSIPTDVYYLTFRVIEKLSKKMEVILLVGNHEQFSKVGDIHSIYPFKSICTVIDQPTVTVSDGCEIVWLPFSVDNKQNLKVIDDNRRAPNSNLLLGHIGLTGAVVGPKERRMKTDLDPRQLKPEKFKWCILGHYHKFQTIEKTIVYVGSMLQHDFGERNEEKWALVFDSNEPDKLKKVRLQAPEFLEVTSENLSEAVKGNYVKVLCQKKDVEAVKVKLQELQPRGYVIEQQIQKQFQPRLNIDPLATTEEMISVYVDHMKPKELDKKRLIKVAESIMKGADDEA